MELARFTKRSCEFAATEASIPDLELPDEPNFRPLPRRVTLEEMMQRNEELRKMVPKVAPTKELGLSTKSYEEFVL